LYDNLFWLLDNENKVKQLVDVAEWVDAIIGKRIGETESM